MATPVLGAFRAFDGKLESLTELVRANVSLLRAKGLLTDTPEVLIQLKNGILVWYEYRDGGADLAHSDSEVLALWSRFKDISDSMGLLAIPGRTVTLPGGLLL